MRVAAVEDVRRQLSSWSRDELLEFAADCSAEFPAVHDRLRRRLASRAGSAAVAFRGQIDQVLAVRHVKWNEVAEFVASLDAILFDLVKHGERQPAEAVDVALWLIGRVQCVCDAVDCEDELGTFCSEAAEAVSLMARDAGLDRLAVARRLLELHAVDGYGVAQELPEVAAGLVTPETLPAFEALFREKGVPVEGLAERAEPADR